MIANTIQFRRKTYRAVAKDDKAGVIVLEEVMAKPSQSEGGGGNGGKKPKAKKAAKAPKAKHTVTVHGINGNRETRHEVETRARKKMAEAKESVIVWKETRIVETDKRIEVHKAYHYSLARHRGADKYSGMTVEKAIDYREPKITKEASDAKTKAVEKTKATASAPQKGKAGSKAQTSNKKKTASVKAKKQPKK